MCGIIHVLMLIRNAGRIWDRLKTPSDKRAAYAEKHKGLSVGNLR